MQERLYVVIAALLLLASFGGLAGCTSAPTQSQAVQWIEHNEAEKRRLEAAGFPQFIGE